LGGGKSRIGRPTPSGLTPPTTLSPSPWCRKPIGWAMIDGERGRRRLSTKPHDMEILKSADPLGGVPSSRAPSAWAKHLDRPAQPSGEGGKSCDVMERRGAREAPTAKARQERTARRVAVSGKTKARRRVTHATGTNPQPCRETRRSGQKKKKRGGGGGGGCIRRKGLAGCAAFVLGFCVWRGGDRKKHSTATRRKRNFSSPSGYCRQAHLATLPPVTRVDKKGPTGTGG